MIQITIERNVAKKVVGFRVEGHAGYSPGNDIVCAGVSAVTIGTVNALIGLGLAFNPQVVHQDGLLDAHFGFETTIMKAAQSVLEAMIIMLRGIEQLYSEYVKISDTGGDPPAYEFKLS